MPHHAQATPQEQIAPATTRQRGGDVRTLLTRPGVQVALAVLLALAVRVLVLWRSQGMMEGDEGTNGLQMLGILRGEFPIYLNGQAYLGMLEAYITVPFVALLGPTAWAVHMGTLLQSLLLIPLSGALATRLYGARARVPALLLAALPPLYVAVGEVRALGGYVETLVLGSALLVLALVIAERWAAGTRTRWPWAGVGVLTGLGLWIDPLVIYYIVAIGLWLAPLALGRLRRGLRAAGAWRATLGTGAAAAGGLVLGAAPAIWYALGHQFANLGLFLTPADALAQAHPLRLGVARYLLTLAAPRVLGIRLRWMPPEVPLAVTLAVGTVAALAALGALGYALVSVMPRRLPARRWEWLAPEAYGQRARQALPVVLLAVTLLVFWRSNSVGNIPLYINPDVAGRYALPLTTPFTLFLAALVAALPTLLARRVRMPVARAATAALLGLVLLAYAVPYVASDGVLTMQTPYQPTLRFPSEQRGVLTYLEQHNIRYLYTSHWLGNTIMYLERERILCTDPVDIFLWGGPDRFPAATRAVLAADRPSFLIQADPTQGTPATLRALDALGVRTTVARFGNLWVITPISRTVQATELLPALAENY